MKPNISHRDLYLGGWWVYDEAAREDQYFLNDAERYFKNKCKYLRKFQFNPNNSYGIVLAGFQRTKYAELLPELGFKLVKKSLNPNSSNMIEVWMRDATLEGASDDR